MESTTISKVGKNDCCANCFATAQFHLRNPFGIYYSGPAENRSYWEWHNKPSDLSLNICNEYMMSTNNHTLDHDELYREMARV